ncbi:MAG: twin-arginine translocase subunit TatC [Anaerolineales bacterium]|nr:twin-arginine translocase subunit TatC [Anaerolineales bacterium]
MSSTTSRMKEATEQLANQMTLLEHLEELRDRLVKAAIAVFVCTLLAAAFTTPILELLIAPYGQKLQVLGPTEGITIYFRVALTAGLVIAMPFLVYQFLMFILPGLEPNEKQYILWGVPFATLLFFIGVLFAWYILTPAAVSFLSAWQPEIFIQQWQSREYIPFVTSLVFWVGLSFETPLIIFIMTKIGLVTPQFLLKQWRFAIVIIAIAAAMITPTVDPFNMGLVMLPLIILYGLSILLSYLA